MTSQPVPNWCDILQAPKPWVVWGTRQAGTFGEVND